MAPPVPTRAALGALLLLLAAVGAAAADAADSLSQCAARGFQPGDLACSTCTKMERVLRPLDSEDARGVVADCRACCSPVLDAVSPVRYAKAELKLCRFSLSQHGGVNEFLEKSGYNDVVDVTDVMGAWERGAGRGARPLRWAWECGASCRPGRRFWAHAQFLLPDPLSHLRPSQATCPR